MRRVPVVQVYAVLVLAVGLQAQRADAGELVRLEPVLRRAVARVAPSVVTVETFGGVRKVLAGGGRPGDAPGGKPRPGAKPPKKNRPRLRQPGFLQSQGATAGVVLSADGWIGVSRFALNFDPTTILVTLPDGRSFEAVRAGEDTSRGLALVKIEATGLPVPGFVAPDRIAVGAWAFALGRTFDRAHPSVHMGIVSAVGRLFGRAVQTDAYTSPANYGGPLIDVDGRVLGIVVPLSRAGRDAGAELYDSGIGFAAVISGLEPLLARMRAGEHLHRGFLGVSTVPDDLGPGARIRSVVKASAAAAAGLRKGDRIVAVDRVKVRNGFHLQNLVGAKMGGDPAYLEVRRRSGETLRITVFLKDLPQARRTPRKPAEEAGELPWEGDPKRDK